MTAQPIAKPDVLAETGRQLPLGELSRRLSAELAAAASICRDCEHIAGDLATGGAPLANLSRLQALDELSQRLHGLSDVLARISQHASGEWSLAIEPLLEGLGLADLVVRLRHAEDHKGWDAEAGELDFF
ncbi:MAG: chemotaxis protein CheU [Caulobacter sp.]|nr:chemotaxis protein CheU [Caulobacter sp.]